MAVLRALGLPSRLAATAAAPSFRYLHRPSLFRTTLPYNQAGQILRNPFVGSRKSLKGACVASSVVAGAAVIVIGASASQQVTEMAPAQGGKDGGGDDSILPDLMTEFMVDMKCDGCVKSVRTKLEPLDGVRSVDVDLENQVVRILGSASVKSLTAALAGSGRKARLIGQGLPESFALSAAVAEFKGPEIHGVVRFTQISMELARFEASFSGLPPGTLGWFINEFGDLTRGAASTGRIFNTLKESAGPDAHPVGDLGVLEVNNEGNAECSGTKRMLQVGDLIGRALVVYGNLDKSKPGIAAAVIARSARVGENYKKLCSCDGTIIWESTNSDFVKV